MPFKSYKIYAAKKRREARAIRDMHFQINMTRKYKLIKLELDRAFNSMRITSTHELTMLMIAQNVAKLSPQFRKLGLAISPSNYSMNSHLGLILCLDIELTRHRLTNQLVRESNRYPFPYHTAAATTNKEEEAIEPWI